MKELRTNKGTAFIVDADIAEILVGMRIYERPARDGVYLYLSISGVSVGLHRFIIGDECKGLVVDHRNRNTLDNRRENLRVCTSGENTKNQGKRKKNTSGYKGVFIHGKRSRWMARIESNNKGYYLGSYETKEAAARAYDRGAIKLHGQFAALNFPLSNYDNEE